jgi:hypothetical protein
VNASLVYIRFICASERLDEFLLKRRKPQSLNLFLAETVSIALSGLWERGGTNAPA